ncbi:DUF5103 domain-containing protein [Mangrovibacterium marinum]|uniref:Uncharacterized protein DUF5103 n=1 Tax=Mangrovibacterium marinum TaxID=1639118 RepID=A0A2T5C016_9BACT|nr:DUF5103 domain-containing protein [Mangrovibacterium marinum]PTN07857.1 uncharacterized protein DUF5103 [Mangrovibacterium marinum]
MFRNCFFLSLISIVIFSLNSRAQAAFDQVYRNQVFIPDIHSVQLFSSGSVLSMPVLSLGTDEQLVLKFDDLSGQVKNYNYTILHCDADWRESFVMQSEYLDGFAENPLDDYALSFNTSMDYVNYQLAIPNQQVRLNYSGNYILLVYEGNDREHPVLSRRFFVLDQQVAVQGQVKKATFDPFQGDNQEVDFSVLHRQLKIEDPFSEIRVVVMKNRRWDSAIRDLKPIFVRDNELVYDYDEQNVFPGGNEFRYFDMRSWKYTGENVDEIGFYQAYYHVRVMPDEIRSNKKYFEYQEMNGNFTVESQDRIQDPDTECDYAFVHFSLAVPVPLVGGTVHVFGALTNWTTGKGTAMSWDAAHKQYDLTLLLKQGYYNYEYVYVPEGATVADETVLEGSHFETENDYQIFVYYKGISDRYEQLVGFTQLNSRSF